MLHKDFVVGTGSGADTDVFAPMLKNMFGAKLEATRSISQWREAKFKVDVAGPGVP